MTPNKLWGSIFAVAILVFVYLIVSAVITRSSTGILSVSTSVSNARIVLTENNRGATIIGTGSARLRLSPGTYYVSAFDAGRRSAVVATIKARHTSDTYINLSNQIGPPSVSKISFGNFDGLVNNGLTTDQINILEQEFFNFKQNSSAVVVSYPSIKAGPRAEGTSSFNLSFQVKIDGTNYNATTTYTGPEDIRLQLMDTKTGAQVFDSGDTTSQSSGG